MPIADQQARILVTRSEPGASVLVDALSKAGYVAVQMPVLAIRPLDDLGDRFVVAGLDRFDYAIFLSGHAVRFGVDLIDAIWPHRPNPSWIAVGAATAAALKERGIVALVPETESSDGILAMPQLSDLAGRRVLICAGRGGRRTLADELVRRGAAVERLALYAREPITVETAQQCLPKGTVSAVVIASVDGARAFAHIWRALGRDSAVPLVAPSARVAAALRKMHFPHVVEADGAGVRSVVAALRTLERHDE